MRLLPQTTLKGLLSLSQQSFKRFPSTNAAITSHALKELLSLSFKSLINTLKRKAPSQNIHQLVFALARGKEGSLSLLLPNKNNAGLILPKSLTMTSNFKYLHNNPLKTIHPCQMKGIPRVSRNTRYFWNAPERL